VRQLAAVFTNLDVPFTFTFTVVDNNSRDGSQEFLQSRPKSIICRLAKISVTGAGINRGVGRERQQYVCVTNTDVILNRDALISLGASWKNGRTAGICAAKNHL